MKTYILASSTEWPISAFMKRRSRLPGRWLTVTTPDDLLAAIDVDDNRHRYIFFPHWSSIVDDWIIKDIECIGFHMSNLPFGRGGTPLQNLIVSGAKHTVVTAFRMMHELDAGPIYCKHNLSLEGAAHDIYARAAEISMEMMEWIVAEEPTPTAQVGDATMFKRRKPEDSVLPQHETLEYLYDFIRMLDADGYPLAFLEWGGYRFEFREAKIGTLGKESLHAKIRISVRRPS